MAFNTTTLSSAVTANDVSIVVASATGVAPGVLGRIDDEIFLVRKDYVSGTTVGVHRGQNGTQTSAHVSGANVTFGLGSDFADAPAQTEVTYPYRKPRVIRSYSANGAITLPQAGQDMVAILNGTNALAMTLANPTKDQDGNLLIIVANGKAAHTVTYTAGIGNGGSSMDVGTYNATELTGCILIAINGFWVLIANGIGSSGTQVAGVVWA